MESRVTVHRIDPIYKTELIQAQKARDEAFAVFQQTREHLREIRRSHPLLKGKRDAADVHEPFSSEPSFILLPNDQVAIVEFDFEL